ncbi:MAG: lipopolysaccharide transport periplasmic protein LptA [Burkholderiaceae bacterium]|nr:lipopolysaccharide transport periplasmic protein LptA [Burkholderiaceae bacterium]MCD8517428.1 lipopolysaccharide transport periplasmic protein LptA [Burkholderiaceae bacterium]MCD8536966.1 lipopolysaccharide transport periplasmic protein LptA [Burkholderiaceae bacterium]MCD8564958.1 lipopolysaccharide transport periplasmic protein LptA [Burkholderiaceae bacterium]
MRTIRLLGTLLVTLALAQPTAGWTQSLLLAASNEGQEEPATQILSNELTYDENTKTSIFIGDVIMTRGLLKLLSDELRLTEDAEGYQYGTATVNEGKRVYIRQDRPENFEVLEGIGERAEYDGKAETFDLIGKARLTRYICGKPFDSVSGERVRYFQKTDRYQAFSGPNSDNPDGRVRSIAQPRAKIDAAIEACRQLQASGAEIPVPPAPKP